MILRDFIDKLMEDLPLEAVLDLEIYIYSDVEGSICVDESGTGENKLRLNMKMEKAPILRDGE